MNNYKLNGNEVNIYDLFFELCEYIEKENKESCSICPLNKFCYERDNANKGQIETFWNEVYSKGHFTPIERF